MVLYISQKAFSSIHKYSISDKKGNLHYYAEGKRRWGIQLYDSKGNELFYIKRKIRGFFKCFEFYKYNRLCAVSFKRISTNSKIKFKIYSIFGTFEIESDLFGTKVGISFEGEMICAVRNYITEFNDVYEVYIENNKNMDFFIAMIISFDMYLKNKGITQ